VCFGSVEYSLISLRVMKLILASSLLLFVSLSYSGFTVVLRIGAVAWVI
jgi:hypothetical protein